MTTLKWGHHAALFVLILVATACDNSTVPEPGMEIDTQAALADYEAIAQALGSDELAGFRALGGRTPFGAASGIDVVAGMTAPGRADGGRAFALDLARRIGAAQRVNGAAAAPIISNWTRGATYVYDPETDRYRLAVGREGAPETGVRFMLYGVDPAGRPLVEDEIGHADLIDEGDSSVEDIVLHLIVVQGEATVLDYRTSLDDTDTGGALTVDGFLQGDAVRLDFDIGVIATDTDGPNILDVAFELRVDARDFSITGDLSGIEEGTDGEGEIDITVRHRDDSIRLDVLGTGGVLDGTVLVNGEVFATVSGPESDLTFLGAGGEPLTFQEFLVLRHIVDAIEDVFDLLEDLLDPVDELVILGIIL